jgi:hypothetical protein
MAFLDTTAAPKYGPTPYYGRCEAPACSATARATCPKCGGQHCLSHAGHDAHAGRAAD